MRERFSVAVNPQGSPQAKPILSRLMMTDIFLSDNLNWCYVQTSRNPDHPTAMNQSATPPQYEPANRRPASARAGEMRRGGVWNTAEGGREPPKKFGETHHLDF